LRQLRQSVWPGWAWLQPYIFGIQGGYSMEIIEENQSGINIYKLSGRLDSNTSQSFEKKIFQAIDDGSKSMIIDFKNLDYISSAGLRVILKATKALKREDGKMMLCDMQDYVKEVFEIAGFDSFLPIVSTMDDALQRFK
jgi:anti-sigma B factor antagonist